METSVFAPIGLQARNADAMLDQIVAAGFNTIRLPYSNQLLDPTIRPMGINFALTPSLQGLNGLGILDYVVSGAARRGLRVVLDRHRPTADSQSELWYPDWLIIVEGVLHATADTYWWGGDLSAAADAPVRLSRPERLVYSA